MAKAKPIEPGCLAITIGMTRPESNGVVVTVIRSLGVQRVLTRDKVLKALCWEVSKPIRKHNGILQTGVVDCNLLRIDGYDESKNAEEKKVEELTA